MELLSVSLIDPIITFFPSQLFHLLCKGIQIIGVDIGFLICSERISLDRAVCRLSLSCKNTCNNGILIQRIIQNADGISVFLPEICAHIHGSSTVICCGELPIIISVLILELRSIVGIQPCKIRLAGLEHGCLCSLIRYCTVYNGFNIRNLSVIIFISFQCDHSAGSIPVFKFITTCSHRILIKGCSIHILSFQKMLRKDSHGKVIQHGSIILIQCKDHSLIIRCLNTCNVLVIAGDTGSQSFILCKLLIGVYNILCIEIFSIMPLNTISKLKSIGIGILVKGIALCKILYRLSIGIIFHQS